jgi:hypothetical protein
MTFVKVTAIEMAISFADVNLEPYTEAVVIL